MNKSLIAFPASAKRSCPLLAIAGILNLSSGSATAQSESDESTDLAVATDEMGESDEMDESDDPPPRRMLRWEERPVSLEAQAGFAGPLSLIGGALDVAVLPRWSVGAGVGLSPGGPQLAASTRYRLAGNDRRAFFVETAFSAGPYRAVNVVGGLMAGDDAPDTDDGYVYRVAPAFWVYAGAGFELRWETASFRVFGGMTPLLNPGSGTCTGEDSHQELPCSEAEERYGTDDGSGMNVLPYVGVAFGRTFGA